MIEWIVSSSVLIVAVLLLRTALKGRISLRLQYALWGLVLLRLLVPVQFGSSAYSVAEATRTARLIHAPEVQRHALCHELTHYRHGDHVWANLKALCLILQKQSL